MTLQKYSFFYSCQAKKRNYLKKIAIFVIFSGYVIARNEAIQTEAVKLYPPGLLRRSSSQ